VLAPDLPGYGLTVTAGAADYADWPRLVADLARTAAVDGPVFLFGLSVGGITALFAAQHLARDGAAAPPLAGVIATTLIDLRDRATFLRATRTRWLGRLALAAFRLGRFTGGLAFPLAWTTPIEALTSDPALARILVRDPLLGRRRVPLGFFRSMHRYTPPAADYALPCPLLLVHPGADTWTPTAMSLPVFAQVPGAKTLTVLSNGAHAPLESPAYAELLAAILAFLARPAAAVPALAS
jgi:alpha-beta hydrolase superfamily lysophospholipase